jgi:hypothetical protein
MAARRPAIYSAIDTPAKPVNRKQGEGGKGPGHGSVILRQSRF